MKNIALIIKGNLKRKERLMRRITKELNPDMNLAFYETEGKGDGIVQAQKAIEEGAGYVIVAGGDGMVNELVNGYMAAEKGMREKVVLGVLPSGTGNDFVKSLGSPDDIGALFELINTNSFRTVDLGEAEYCHRNGEMAKRYFANIIDIGLGGYVVKNLEASGTFINANLTYQKAIIQTFLAYKHVRVKIESTALKWEGPVLSLVFAKGKYFGSGICIAPDALLDDGKMHLVVIGNVSLWDYLKNLGKIRKGMKLDHPEAKYMTIGDCSISSLRGECPIDMDGEFVGFAPLKVKVIPGAVRFLAG